MLIAEEIAPNIFVSKGMCAAAAEALRSIALHVGHVETALACAAVGGMHEHMLTSWGVPGLSDGKYPQCSNVASIERLWSTRRHVVGTWPLVVVCSRRRLCIRCEH